MILLKPSVVLKHAKGIILAITQLLSCRVVGIIKNAKKINGPLRGSVKTKCQSTHVFSGNENVKTFQRTKSTLFSSLFTNVFLKTQYAN